MATAFSYRSNLPSSGSESDDSDNEGANWKRNAKRPAVDEDLEAKPTMEVVAPSAGPKAKKRNNIWSDVLQDQMISETLDECGIKQKPADYGSRGPESYDYTLKYQDSRYLSEKRAKMEEQEDQESPTESSGGSTEDVLEARRKRFQPEDEPEKQSGDAKDESKPKHFHHGKSRREFKKHPQQKYSGPGHWVDLDPIGRAAANKIIKVLKEEKQYMMYRIVKHLGVSRAMDILKQTEKIEEGGGMMVVNKSRRRSPGGVYLYLVRNDKGISEDTKSLIFAGESESYEAKMRLLQRKRLEKQRRKEAQRLKNEARLAGKEEAKQNSDESKMDGDDNEQSNENLESMEVTDNSELPASAIPEDQGTATVTVNEAPAELEEGELSD